MEVKLLTGETFKISADEEPRFRDFLDKPSIEKIKMSYGLVNSVIIFRHAISIVLD
jgi:hypothetical protein